MNQPLEADVATPDFYRYRWAALDRVAVDERFVRVTWTDGTTLDAFDLWLLENAIGSGGIDPATREGLIDPAHFDPETRVADASIDPTGALIVRFSPDGRTARYHPGWLRHIADEQHRPASWLATQQLWTATELAEPPTHDGPLVLADDESFRAWINDLVQYGLARLRRLPDDPDVALQLAAKIGAIRDTNFGPIWDVKADVELAGAASTNSTANTNLRLGPHTDLPTRETPPGYQFLHCYANEAEGGNSTMADGAAVVAALADEHPGYFDALTSLNWIFFNRGPGIDHRWSGPIIDLGVDSAPLTLRAFYPVRAFPDMDPSDIPRVYEAMRCFSTLAASDRFQIDYAFEAGDLVGFDNRRILHGRAPFSAGGRRHLRGIYIDHDEILSTARVVNRQHAHRSDALGTVTDRAPEIASLAAP